jgi:cytochrome P450 family 710 subfamily A protein
MDFLFASQDASTASLCWVLALMAEHPDVLARVREEQRAVRPNDEPLNYDMLEQMPFTRQVVMEVLRYRPPAMMVPQLASKDVKLTEDFTAKKGSIVIPSLWASCRNGYENGEEFIPDRFAPERKDTWAAHTKSWMVFGCGNHSCVGQRYAIHHLICFLAVLSTTVEWDRVRTARSQEVDYLPTLYPADCIMHFKSVKAM